MKIYRFTQTFGFISPGMLLKENDEGDFVIDFESEAICKGQIVLTRDYVETISPQIIQPVHEWWVVSTVLGERALMLECANFRITALVHNPTREEWSEAFSAPDEPYRWLENNRVSDCSV
jgi:hypothetical protein